MARPAGMAIFIQAKRLANKAEVRENDTERPLDADSNEEYSNSKELPQPSATDGAKEHDEYYSLKMHREGPNTEGGELDPKSKSKDVKRHNKDMANRYEKR
ncbi:uncharacterized protein N7496_010732 [Penicillium cataractarum]|uniref:Uncharacterized protein n=1 Tax=Penicillium cataractarum TaxID=2100454 RepID=A0A9W9RFG2_9EURO|nr:uncharacterized protein N7496_010732 [Penicillium cataractarum]KAJ5358319.1 hypothetical protein N7496_010732 [Penicillium cataractarum]